MHMNIPIKMPFTFTRDQVKVLLQEYEKYPELYNVDNIYYKNKTKRQECIENITRVLQLSCDNSITFEEVKKKINGIRTQYFSEISKQKKSQTSGAGTSDVYKTTWWCFDLLHFLRNSAPTRRGESNLDIQSTQEVAILEAGDEVDVEVIYEGPADELQNINYEDILSPTFTEDKSRPSTSHSTEPPRKKKKTDSQVLMEKATTLLANITSSVEDQLDAFGQYVAAELRQVKNKKNVSNLKRRIMDLLLQALEEEEDT